MIRILVDSYSEYSVFPHEATCKADQIWVNSQCVKNRRGSKDISLPEALGFIQFKQPLEPAVPDGSSLVAPLADVRELRKWAFESTTRLNPINSRISEADRLFHYVLSGRIT